MFAVEGHHLANFDHAAFQFSQFISQILSLLGDHFPPFCQPLVFWRQGIRPQVGGSASACKHACARDAHATLEFTGFDAFYGITAFAHSCWSWPGCQQDSRILWPVVKVYVNMLGNDYLLETIEKMRMFTWVLPLLLGMSISPLLKAEPLYDLINQRLGYMKDVAVHKAKENMPIEDKSREQVVLTGSIEKAQQLGLDAGSVEAFFVAQIDVAKAIQRRYHQQWALRGDHERFPLPDLSGSIRPELSRLGDEIIEQLPVYLSRYGSIAESKRPEFLSNDDDGPVNTGR